MEQTVNGLTRKSQSFYFWLLKHKKQVILITLLVLLPIILSAGRVLAEEATDDSVKAVLTKYSDLFKLRSVISDFLKALLGSMIYLWYFVVYHIESVLLEVLSFFGFVEFLQNHSIYTSLISTLVGVLMAGTLVWIGTKIIINQGQVPQMKLVTQNLIVSFFLILGLPFFMGWMQEAVEIVWDSANTVENEQLTNTVINNHFYDLYLPLNSSQNFDDYMSQENPKINNIKEPSDFNKLQLNEFFHPSEHDFVDKGDSEDILGHTLYLKYDDNNEEDIVVEEVEEAGFFKRMLGDVFETGYYRYQWDTIPILVALTALGVAFVFVTFTIIMTYIELGFKLLFSPIALATDLETGQRTKQVVHDVINAFLTIAFEIVAFRIFVIYIKWIADSGMNSILYLVGMVAGAIVLIQGSKTVLRWFGVDTGLTEGYSGFRSFMRYSGASYLGNKLARRHRESKQVREQEKHREDLSQRIGTDNSKEELSGTSKMARDLGYVTSRGASGLAREGASLVGDKLADHTYKPVVDGAKELSEQFTEGREKGRERYEADLNQVDSEKSSELDRAREIIQNSDLSETEKTSALQKVSKAQDMSPETASSHVQQVMNEAGIHTPEVQDAIRQIHDEHIPSTISSENTTRQIDEQVNTLQEAISRSTLPEEEKQQILQEISKAEDLSPEMASSHVQQVMSEAGIDTPQVQTAIRQIQDVNASSLSQPEMGTRQVNDQVFNQTESLTPANRQVVESLSSTNVSDLKGANLSEKQETLRQRVIQESTTPEALEQSINQVVQQSGGSIPTTQVSDLTQRVQTIRDEANQQNLSNELVKQRVEREVSSVLENTGTKPTEVRQVVEQISNASIGNTTSTQRVLNGIDTATQATTSQVARNISRTVIPEVSAQSGVTKPIRREIQEIITRHTQDKSATPQDVIQHVKQDVSKVDFGEHNDVKQRIIQHVEQSSTANEQQFQNNLRTLSKQEKDLSKIKKVNMNE